MYTYNASPTFQHQGVNDDKQTKMIHGRIRVSEVAEGETIEQQVYKMIYEKEVPKHAKVPIYTERKHGVLPAYNPKTDKFDIAAEVMSKAAKTATMRVVGNNETTKNNTTTEDGEHVGGKAE